jgi:hypothetical protein
LKNIQHAAANLPYESSARFSGEIGKACRDRQIRAQGGARVERGSRTDRRRSGREIALRGAQRESVHPAQAEKKKRRKKGNAMLWTICVILLVLWVLGMVTSTTMGGLIHVLLVVAIVVVLIQLIQGRRVV